MTPSEIRKEIQHKFRRGELTEELLSEFFDLFDHQADKLSDAKDAFSSVISHFDNVGGLADEFDGYEEKLWLTIDDDLEELKTRGFKKRVEKMIVSMSDNMDSYKSRLEEMDMQIGLTFESMAKLETILDV